jgi:Calx-beta domain/Domain of unknown function (DUF4214)
MKVNLQCPITANDRRVIARLSFVFVAIIFCNVAASAAVFTVINTDPAGPGSFVQAINDANNNPGLDTIAFNIPGAGFHTISPNSTLPKVTDPVIIDGTTQPGFSGTPLIVLNGSNITDPYGGLNIRAGNSTVRGLVLNGFKAYALSLVTNGNNVVVGNYVGTNAAGTAAFPATDDNSVGIYVTSANNIIGGTTAADRNLIAGNHAPSGGRGLWIDTVNATGNKVIGNYFGTDVTGMTYINNNRDNISLTDCSSNVIGGPTAAERNVIANGYYGIVMSGTAHHNRVIGNYIGTDASGLNGIQNANGISIDQDAHDNSIGGTAPGEGNLIAYNILGIWIGPRNINNTILGNSIYSTYLYYLGIDLYSGAYGVTPNDDNTGDADTGANNLQNFPVLTSVTQSGGTTNIEGTLDSAFSTQFRVEFFSNETCHPSGFGEGQKFLGFTNVSIDASGKASFTFNTPTASLLGSFITATATDPQGNTSEFSACASGVVASPGTLQLSTNFISKAEDAGSFVIQVTRSNGSTGTVSVHYATADGTANAPSDYTATSGTLTFNDGELSKSISVPLIDDTTPEGSETFTLSLTNPTGGAVLGNITSATLSIQDNEQPSLSISDVTLVEGDAGTTNATFMVTLSDPITNTVQVNYATADGTASQGVDYQPTGGLLTFSPGQTQKTITVLVNGDTVNEPDENFFVNLSNPDRAVISRAQGRATIINDDGATPPVVQFSDATYSVQEALTAATITVIRSGDTSVEVTVDYSTANPAGYAPCDAATGVASQNCDYTTALGTLKFAAGETSKSFVVLVNEDSYAEGNEVVNLTLSNAKGASLGNQSTAALTITDDAFETQSNPNDDAQNFVYQHYHDFLNREPDSGGLNYWTSQITQCGADPDCISARRRDVSAAYYGETEFQVTGSYVYKLYKASYGVFPTYGQFIADRGRVSSASDLEQSKQAFADEFVGRPTFVAVYPQGLTSAEYVNKLYDTAKLVPFTSERQQAIDALMNNTKTRADVLRDVIEISEFKQREYNPGFVLMQYFGYLRRDPDQGGYDFWLNILNTVVPNDPTGYHAMVCAFITSDEYQNRFSSIHTHANSECR